MHSRSFKRDRSEIRRVESIPVDLAESLQGTYFVGFADKLCFGNHTGAWARLHNPSQSHVNLFANVWTVTSQAPYLAQLWLNAIPSGTPQKSRHVTPTNTSIQPPPKPSVRIQFSANVTNPPVGGALAYSRLGEPNTTLVAEEDGKFIIPPGGSFMIFLTNPGGTSEESTANVAFGWWEKGID